MLDCGVVAWAKSDLAQRKEGAIVIVKLTDPCPVDLTGSSPACCAKATSSRQRVHLCCKLPLSPSTNVFSWTPSLPEAASLLTEKHADLARLCFLCSDPRDGGGCGQL